MTALTSNQARLVLWLTLTGEFPSERVVAYRDRHGNLSKMRVSGSSSSGSVLDKVLSRISDESLIAECRRRGLEVSDV